MHPQIERDTMEVAVTTAWRRILGKAPNTLDEDFFDVGGTSLLAARLASALGTSTGAEVSLDAVFEGRNVRGISARLRQQPGSARRLVTLNPEGTGAPLILVPTGAGGIAGFQRLAGPPLSRPVHGLLARGLNPADGKPYVSLDELVDDLAAILCGSPMPRRVHLGGFCAGGIFAYELGRRLMSEGWTVLSVSLFNTALGTAPVTADFVIQERLTSLAASAGLSVGPGRLDVGDVFARINTTDFDLLEKDVAAFTARINVFGALAEVAAAYEPKPVEVPVRLYRAQTEDQEEARLLERWVGIGISGFSQEAVPVGHYELLRHEPTLAAIEAFLHSVDERSGTVRAPLSAQ